MSCPCSSTGCGGSNTAATTRRASRSCTTARVELRRSAGKLSNLEQRHRRRSDSRRLRRRPHALGDARPADRGERAPAPRLHRQDRRRPQRHHRELPRSEARAPAPGPPVRHRDRHRDRRAPGRARDEGRRARERGAARADADARPVRARADLGRRPGEDRRGPQRAADRRRPGRRRVLRRVRHPGDPQPHARRRLPRRRGDGGRHADRRRVHGFLRAAPVSKATERVLWDPIMAEKAGYKHFMLKEIFEQPTAARETILGRVSQDSGQRVPRGDAARRGASCARSTGSPSSPAARPGTRRWSASS